MAYKLDAKTPAGELAQKWSNHKAAIKVVSPANKRKLDIIVVGTGLGGASAAASLGELGYNVEPAYDAVRHHIIQTVQFGNPEGLCAFCRGIQAGSPVDSFVTPEPWAMPGYDSDVIMAAGAFVSGSSIELSADGPVKEPYAVYFQGGLTWYHAKIGILMSLQEMVNAGLVRL